MFGLNYFFYPWGYILQILALVHAVFSVSLRADQIVSGTALNFVALGLTGYLYIDVYGDQGTPDDLPQIPDVHLPIGSLGFFGLSVELS